MKNEEVKKVEFKNLKMKTVLLCEACGSYHPEEECEIILVKIIKGKNCTLNMTKEQTFARPTTPAVEIPKVTMNENIPIGFSPMPANQVREIVPNGIKKNDPRLLRPTVSGPGGMKIPTMADMMKEPGS
jgi:hypothetical protein